MGRIQKQKQQRIDRNNQLQSKLFTGLKNSSQEFLKCDAFAAALLLDPRFMWKLNYKVLNDGLHNKGITQLLKIHKKKFERRAIQQ